jgi:predicted P-loop ATPase
MSAELSTLASLRDEQLALIAKGARENPMQLPAHSDTATKDWREYLARRGNGYAGDERNIIAAFRHARELQRLVHYNEFALHVEFTRAPPWREIGQNSRWTDADDTALTVWLQERDIAVTNPGKVADTTLLAAQEHAFHPVREYLQGLVWDGVPRLAVWLASYLSAEGSAVYLAAIGRRFLVSAVARIMAPGCQADHVLVIEGAQGIGKTSAARALAVRPEWFAGNLPDIHSKDAAIQLLGHWIIEISELKAIRNSQQEATKSFITETVDTFRPPYGRRTAQFPRQCVFIATTNESEYLRDRTGNRRFWPVRCGHVDVDVLVRDRDQLWAEAVQQYWLGTAWHLTDAEIAIARDEQGARVFTTELESDVASYLRSLRDRGKIETSVKDVLVSGLGLKVDAPTYVEAARKIGSAVAEAMELAGWKKVCRARTDEGRRTVYRYFGQGGQG